MDLTTQRRAGDVAALLLLGAWFDFLAFGGLTRAEAVKLGDDFHAGRLHFPADAGRVLRGYPADDGDIRRAWAYARATLGRSHSGFYVRTAPAWREAFARGDLGSPEAWPQVTPPAPLRPWRDFLVEYPPGFFLAALPPALLARTGEEYRTLFALEMAVCTVLGLVIAERLRRRATDPGGPSALRWGALFAFLVGIVVTHRSDALVLLQLAALVWAVVDDRPGLAGALTALLVWTKGVPAVPGVFLMLPRIAARRWTDVGRWALAGLGTGVVLFLPFLALAGPALLEAVRYQSERPVQVESTAAALLGLIRVVAPAIGDPVQSHGATGVVGPGAVPLADACQLLLVLGLGAVAWRARRASTAGALALTAMAPLVLWMTLGRVFSPQFLVWVLPLAALAGALRSRRALAAFATICALNQAVYPGAYESLKDLAPWACALVLVRNVALLGWTVALLAQATVRPGLTGALTEPPAATAQMSSPMARS
ncbi:MAG: glycosyltransferase 87 family protein [Myxococcaceae bacterium]